MNICILSLLILAHAFCLIELKAQEPQNDRFKPDSYKTFGSSLDNPRKKLSNTDQIASPRPSNHLKESDDVLRVETSLVVNEIMVYDKDGKAVRGLQRSDFRIEEDGEVQDIEFFSLGDDGSAISRTIVLLIDYSGSQLPYIDTSVSAAISLVEMLNPNDRLAIVTDDVELLTDFTSDKSLLREKLEMLRTRALSRQLGKSKQYSALMASIRELFQTDHLRPVIIFQTDGDQLPRLKHERSTSTRTGASDVKFSHDDIIKAAEKAGTTVYSVIPGIRLDQATGDDRLELARKDIERTERTLSFVNKTEYRSDPTKISPRFLSQWSRVRLQLSSGVSTVAERTGGWTEYLEYPEQAQSVYSRILADMNQRYVIGYYPKNTAHDGKRRNMKITLRAGLDFRIRGRESYIARGGDN